MDLQSAVNHIFWQLDGIDSQIATVQTAILHSDLGVKLNQLEGHRAELLENLKRTIGETKGVIKAEYGQAGYQTRRTLTFKPETIRKHLPELAPLVIVETVDKKTLETMVKAGIKAGKFDGATLDVLEAEAEIKETQAWICKAEAPKREPVLETSGPIAAEEMPF